MEHREATGQRQIIVARADAAQWATTRLRAVTTRNRCMADGIARGAHDSIANARRSDAGGSAPSRDQGQRTFLEYGLPNTAASASFGAALRTTTSSESVRRRMREKSRYRA
jgi:hypothetical protein